jgi:hypothetical protein
MEIDATEGFMGNYIPDKPSAQIFIEAEEVRILVQQILAEASSSGGRPSMLGANTDMLGIRVRNPRPPRSANKSSTSRKLSVNRIIEPDRVLDDFGRSERAGPLSGRSTRA